MSLTTTTANNDDIDMPFLECVACEKPNVNYSQYDEARLKHHMIYRKDTCQCKSVTIEMHGSSSTGHIIPSYNGTKTICEFSGSLDEILTKIVLFVEQRMSLLTNGNSFYFHANHLPLPSPFSNSNIVSNVLPQCVSRMIKSNQHTITIQVNVCAIPMWKVSEYKPFIRLINNKHDQHKITEEVEPTQSSFVINSDFQLKHKN